MKKIKIPKTFEYPDTLNENFGIIEIFGIKIWLLKSHFGCGLSICMWNKKIWLIPFMNFMTCLFAEYRGSNTVFYDNQWFVIIKIKNYNALCNCSKESICLKVLFSLRVKFFNSKICASLRFDSSMPSTATIRWAELFFTLDS